MLDPSQPLAIYMDAHLGDPHGKMGYGLLRYAPNPVTCVIDHVHAGRRVLDVVASARDCAVVASVDEARALGADVLVLGIAPSGGRLPGEWLGAIDRAVALGMCVVNGLHRPLAPRYPNLAGAQWVWDVRVEPDGLGIGRAAARELRNRRVLTVGTDMATGKMTAALEICRAAAARGVHSRFLATGQIGIVIAGAGLALDAVRLDYACGAVEQLVMGAADAELAVVEGQGAIIHPGSSATLPLLRGTCPTHLVLCHRAGQTHLRQVEWLRIPPLLEVAQLYERLAAACGALPRPRTAAVSLNTAGLSDSAALAAVAAVEEETGLPATDPLRHGAAKLLAAVLE